MADDLMMMCELDTSIRADGSMCSDLITNESIISDISIGNQTNLICDTTPAKNGIFPVSAK